MEHKGAKIAGGALATALVWTLFTRPAEAKPLPGNPACTDDADCLGKRYAVQTPSKVSAVIAAARLTSDADPKTTSTGKAWVDAEHGFGFAVVTSDDKLGEGAILLAMEPDAAAELVAGGLFRYV